MRQTLRLCAASLLLPTITPLLLHAAKQTPLKPQESVVPGPVVAKYLRQNNGLVKLTNAIHRSVTLPVSDESWGDDSLRSLMDKSDAVVLGYIDASTVALSDDGDSVWSNFHIQPRTLLKGTIATDIHVRVPGGKLLLPNGYWVSMVNPIEQNIAMGQPYVLFLKKTETGYVLTSPQISILRIDDSTQRIHLQRSWPGKEGFEREVESSTLSALITMTPR